jgi:hypothetical protein
MKHELRAIRAIAVIVCSKIQSHYWFGSNVETNRSLWHASSSSSSIPIVSYSSKGFHEASPSTSVRCQPLHLLSRPSFFLCLFHNWSLPCLLWSSSLPRALWVQIQHNPSNCIWILPNSMLNTFSFLSQAAGFPHSHTVFSQTKFQS